MQGWMILDTGWYWMILDDTGWYWMILDTQSWILDTGWTWRNLNFKLSNHSMTSGFLVGVSWDGWRWETTDGIAIGEESELSHLLMVLMSGDGVIITRPAKGGYKEGIQWTTQRLQVRGTRYWYHRVDVWWVVSPCHRKKHFRPWIWPMDKMIRIGQCVISPGCDVR